MQRHPARSVDRPSIDNNQELEQLISAERNELEPSRSSQAILVSNAQAEVDVTPNPDATPNPDNQEERESEGEGQNDPVAVTLSSQRKSGES